MFVELDTKCPEFEQLFLSVIINTYVFNSKQQCIVRIHMSSTQRLTVRVCVQALYGIISNLRYITIYIKSSARFGLNRCGLKRTERSPPWYRLGFEFTLLGRPGALRVCHCSSSGAGQWWAIGRDRSLRSFSVFLYYNLQRSGPIAEVNSIFFRQFILKHFRSVLV